MKTWPIGTGSLFALFGLFGFLSIADDLEHMSEIYLSSAVLLAGIAFLLVFAVNKRKLPSVN